MDYPTLNDPTLRPGRGGARSGAGRKPGHFKYGEISVSLRVPASMAQAIQQVLAAYHATDLTRLAIRFDGEAKVWRVDYVEPTP